MGIVQRQSLKHSFFQYAGVGVGLLSMLYLYPHVIGAYGLAQALFAAASFIAPIVSMGAFLLAVRFFPDFKDSKTANNGFLGLLLLIAGSGFFLFYLGFPFLEKLIADNFFGKANSPWYAEFLPYVVPFTFFVVVNRLLAIYASNFQRIVIPSILEEFLLKITLPFLLLLFLNEIISINWVINGILINYAVGTFGLSLYLWSLGSLDLFPRLNFITKSLRKRMSLFAGYGVVNAVGVQAGFRIDTLMVSSISFESTGFYSNANFMSEAMSKPQKSIVGITAPLISKAIQENDMAEVKNIYKKSSLTLLIIGFFLFIGLWTCIDDIITIMGNPKMEVIKYPMLFLCLARLFNMGTGVNNEIIGYSKYFRFNSYMVIFLAVANVSLNLLLLRFGIIGAAIATFASFIVYNLAKLFFIKVKFGFHPFSRGTLIVIALAMVSYLLTFLLPEFDSPYLNILLKGSLITAIFPISIFKTKISKDYNKLVISSLEKFAPFLLRFF